METNKQNLVLMVVIGVMVIGLVFVGVSVLRDQDKLLLKAEEKEARYRQEIKDLENVLKLGEEVRQKAVKQQQVVKSRITTRDHETSSKIEAVTVPDKPLEGVASDSEKYLHIAPEVTLDRLSFLPTDVQKLVAMGIEREKLEGDLQDTKLLLEQEEKKSESLQADLAAVQSQVESADVVIEAYKKAAKRSVFRKVLDRSKDIGLAVAVAVIVKKVM